MTIAPGVRVRIRVTVEEEPLIPAPHERKVNRMPHVHEVGTIAGNLAALKLDEMKTGRLS